MKMHDALQIVQINSPTQNMCINRCLRWHWYTSITRLSTNCHEVTPCFLVVLAQVRRSFISSPTRIVFVHKLNNGCADQLIHASNKRASLTLSERLRLL